MSQTNTLIVVIVIVRWRINIWVSMQFWKRTCIFRWRQLNCLHFKTFTSLIVCLLSNANRGLISFPQNSSEIQEFRISHSSIFIPYIPNYLFTLILCKTRTWKVSVLKLLRRKRWLKACPLTFTYTGHQYKHYSKYLKGHLIIFSIEDSAINPKFDTRLLSLDKGIGFPINMSVFNESRISWHQKLFMQFVTL